MVRQEDRCMANENCKKNCSTVNETAHEVSRDVIQSKQDSLSLEVEQVKIDTEKPKAPDGGWGWFVVLGCFIVHFILGGFERSSGIIYLQLLSRYNRSATTTAWVLSIVSTLRLLLAPIASVLCNRFSCRAVVMLGAAISSIAVLTSGFAPELSYMYLSYGVLCGIGTSLVYTPSVIAVGIYFNKRRGIAVGLSSSGFGFGCFPFPPSIELLFNYYGFSWTFVILSAVISNFFVCGAFFRPLELQWKLMEYKRKQMKGFMHEEVVDHLLPSKLAGDTEIVVSGKHSSGLTSSPGSTAKEDIESKSLPLFKRKMSQVKSFLIGKQTSRIKKPLLQFSLFKNFVFCTLFVQLFLFTLSLNIASLFLPALAKERGVSNVEGAYLVSILGICDGLSRLISSTLLDLKRVKQFRLIIYNAIMFFVAIVFILLPSMTTFWQLAVVSGLYGILSGTYISQKSIVVVDVVGVNSLSSAFGFLMFAQGFSNLIGSTVGGMFKDFLGSYDLAFYFGAVGIVFGGLTMAAGNIWLYKKSKASQTEENELTDFNYSDKNK